MFIRQLYYNKDNGNLVYGYSMNYFHTDETPRLDFAEAFPHIDVETIGLMEWLEPDEEIEAKMNGNYTVTVDVTVTPHQLVFTEIPEPEPIPEDEQNATVEDYEAALKELGV